MSHNRSRLATAFAAVVAVGLIAGAPLAALSEPSIQLTSAALPYTVAGTCDVTQPLVSIFVWVKNAGNGGSVSQHLGTSDDKNALFGDQNVPPLAPGQSVGLMVPLHVFTANQKPLPGAEIGGPHVISLGLGFTKPYGLLTVPITVPQELCPPTPNPALLRTTTRSKSIYAITPTPKPGVETSATARSNSAILIVQPPGVSMGTNKNRNRAWLLKIAAPSNVKSAKGYAECGAHAGLIGALVCPDLIKNGSLMLVWDWQASTGPEDIDGYRVYRVDAGLKQLVDTRTHKDQTLSGLASSAADNGKCYAVSAFAGNRESDVSSAICPGGGSVAQTTVLQPHHMRSSERYYSDGKLESSHSHSFLQVGFRYDRVVLLVGDSADSDYSRAAVDFDLSALLHRQLVAAKLRMTIRSSRGGANKSCMTDVGTAMSAWWNNDEWLEGQFSVPTSDVGPEVSVDVTAIVSQWLGGAANNGFVMKNNDENPNAFTIKECMAIYNEPVLELTYY